MNKLNIKMALLTGLLSFLVALTIGTYSNITSTKQLEISSGESLQKLSKNVANTLDREMLERYREIEFASTLYPFISDTSTKKEKRDFLEKMRSQYNHHEWIGFALPDGTVEVGTNRYLEGKNAKKRPWHPAGLKGPYIGDVHDALLLAKLMPNTTGEAIYFSDVAFPVKNTKGEVKGVLVTHLMWQWTRDVIRSIATEHNIEIFLLSKDGMVLVGPGTTERQMINEISPSVAQYLKTAGNSSHKLLQWNEGGTNYLTAQTISTGFEEYEGFNWQVVVRQPQKDAFSISNTNSQHILIASFATAIIGALIGIFFSSRISSPVKELSSIVEDLSLGKKVNFKDKISNDEVGTLYKNIKELYNNLNKVSHSKSEAEDRIKISLQVFDQSIEGILITDKDNKAILANKSFEKITGYTQEDIYGQNPKILGTKNNSKEFYEDLWNKLETEGKWEGYISNKRKNGTTYKEFLRISTLKDDNGNVMNYVATFVGVEDLIKEII